MPTVEQIASAIEEWNIKTYSTQFSGQEHHVCERQKDSWGTIFKNLSDAKKELGRRRAEAVRDLYAKAETNQENFVIDAARANELATVCWCCGLKMTRNN